MSLKSCISVMYLCDVIVILSCILLLFRRSTEFDYEVRHIAAGTTEKFFVNLQRRSCDCRKWYLTSLPCCHAIACMRSQDIDINDYVPDIFKKEQYAACYAPVIYPANGQSLWERTEYNDLQPPPIRKQPGRPKKKRNKEAGELMKDEYGLRRARWGLKCSRCKQSGHNKSTCKLPPPPPPPESSQPATAQAPTSQPASSQAATSQPATTQAATAQTPTSQPASSQAATSQPATTQAATAQPASAKRNTQGRGTFAQRKTQGTSATSSQNQKTTKRKQKDQPSSTQPETSKGKKKKVSARRDAAASTQ